MQIPQQIYFKNASPKGAKLTATIEGNDLPNIIQVKGTNDIAKVKRTRDHDRPNSWGPEDERDEREDDDEYDRDQHGCHRSTVAKWDSKCKYTSLKQTLLFIKKRNCTRVVQEASYDEQGKLIIVTPTSTISTSSGIALNDKTVEIKWTSVQEIMVREYSAETKLSSQTTWKQFDIETPMGAGTTYLSCDVPSVTGTHEYRLVANFTNNATPKILLTQSIPVTIPTGGSATVNGFSAVFNENVGSIDVSWRSLTEVALIRYVVQAKGAQDNDFVDILPPVDAVGQDQPYLFPAFLDEGNYTIQLKAEFQDGTSALVQGTTVTASVPVLI